VDPSAPIARVAGSIATPRSRGTATFAYDKLRQVQVRTYTFWRRIPRRRGGVDLALV
jgi:hypothetical protein